MNVKGKWFHFVNIRNFYQIAWKYNFLVEKLFLQNKKNEKFVFLFNKFFYYNHQVFYNLN